MKTKNMYLDGRRKSSSFLFSRISSLIIPIICLSLFFLVACQNQTKTEFENTSEAKTETVSISPPKVTQIDEQGLKDLLKPNGKPVLINFWATWCGPCREEFPDLVTIGDDYKEKIDLLTVSLDEPSGIDGEVAKFLGDMRSASPAYLLKTADQGEAIEIVSSEWQGALPFTILLDAQGERIYSKQGKFKKDVLVAEIEKLF